MSHLDPNDELLKLAEHQQNMLEAVEFEPVDTADPVDGDEEQVGFFEFPTIEDLEDAEQL